MGLLDRFRQHAVDRKFTKSPLGKALRLHAQEFFYRGQALYWMREDNKQKLITDLYQQLVTAQQSENPAMVLREKLTAYVLVFCQLATLCLTEDEKREMHYSNNPYISGAIHRRIVEAAPHVEEAAQFIWQQDGTATAEELMNFANTRSAIMLFYANGLTQARIAIGDADPTRDWYKPFVEAMMVWEEDTLREKLGMPRLVPGVLHALPYSAFMNHVVSGERNPFYTWTKEWPHLPIGG